MLRLTSALQLEEPAPTADILPPAVEADDGTEEDYTPLDRPWYADRLAQYKLYPEHCAVDAASNGTSIDGQLDSAEQYRRIHLKVRMSRSTSACSRSTAHWAPPWNYWTISYVAL